MGFFFFRSTGLATGSDFWIISLYSGSDKLFLLKIPRMRSSKAFSTFEPSSADVSIKPMLFEFAASRVKQQRDRDLRKWWDQQIFPFPTVTRCNLVKLARGYVRSLHGPTNRFNSNFCSIYQVWSKHMYAIDIQFNEMHSSFSHRPLMFLSYVSHISIKYSIVHIPSFPLDFLWNLVNLHSELRLSVNY